MTAGEVAFVQKELLGDERNNRLKLLRTPFPKSAVGKLPKPFKKDAEKGKCPECGGWHGLPAAHLDYVGHAAVTALLLDVDPQWTWEPVALDPEGLPAFDRNGGLWIRLTICGVTRLGYGDSGNGKGPKECIGDALRNAAMRFGVALELWSKEDLFDIRGEVVSTNADGTETRQAGPLTTPPSTKPEPASAPLVDAAAEADHVKRCGEINGRLAKFDERFAIGIWRAAEGWAEREHMLSTALDYVNATVTKLGTKGLATTQSMVTAVMEKHGWDLSVNKDTKGIFPKKGFPTKPQVVAALAALLGPNAQAVATGS